VDLAGTVPCCVADCVAAPICVRALCAQLCCWVVSLLHGYCWRECVARAHGMIHTVFVCMCLVLQIKNGSQFVSETDTEVIPKLLKFAYDNWEGERLPFPKVSAGARQQIDSCCQSARDLQDGICRSSWQPQLFTGFGCASHVQGCVSAAQLWPPATELRLCPHGSSFSTCVASILACRERASCSRQTCLWPSTDQLMCVLLIAIFLPACLPICPSAHVFACRLAHPCVCLHLYSWSWRS
jgi:hypothetical protein